jgi:uncharacterized protein
MNVRVASRAALVALAVLAAAGTVRPAAAQAPAGPPPSPAALLIAKQIIEVKGANTLFAPIVRGVVEKARQTFLQANFMWSKDINEIAAEMHKDYDGRVTDLIDASARIYATHFTEAELKEMLTFYKSPLGQKMIAEEPKVMDESMANAGAWADNLSQDVLARMRAEMKKRGHDL